MRHAKMMGYVLGCVGVLTVGAALAKDPQQTAASALSTPAGCTDSDRGRTHVLRFCGATHYWIKRPVGPGPVRFDAIDASSAASYGTGGGAQSGPAQNWGGFQRY